MMNSLFCIGGLWVLQPVQPGAATAPCAAGTAGQIQWTGAALQYCDGSIWNSLGGSAISLGTSASATNPQRSGDATTGLFSPAIDTLSIATGGAEALRVDSSGNVGIGAFPVGARLDVLTSGTSIARFLSAGGYTGVVINETASGYGQLKVQDSGGREVDIVSYSTDLTTSEPYVSTTADGSGLTLSTARNSDGSNLRLTARGDLIFNSQDGVTSPSERMRVANTGNVGIGTTVPSQLLTVGDGIGSKYVLVNGANSGTTGGAAVIIQNAGTAIATLGNASAVNGGAYNSDFRIFTIGKILFSTGSLTSHDDVIDTSGNVGIGSTIPVTSLDISQKTDAIILPGGTTAQRPTAVNGMIRYNSTTSILETYMNGTWVPVGAGQVDFQTASSPQTMTGSDVVIYTGAAPIGLAAGQCVNIQAAATATGAAAGSTTMKLYADGTLIHTWYNGGSMGEEDWTVYCNNPGSTTVQTRYAPLLLQYTGGGNGTLTLGSFAGSTDGTVSTPASVTWGTTTHTLYLKANAASGTVSGAFWRVYY